MTTENIDVWATRHCRLGVFQDSDFLEDLEDSKPNLESLMYLWKPNICHRQLDVQETNVSLPKFYRI